MKVVRHSVAFSTRVSELRAYPWRQRSTDVKLPHLHGEQRGIERKREGTVGPRSLSVVSLPLSTRAGAERAAAQPRRDVVFLSLHEVDDGAKHRAPHVGERGGRGEGAGMSN